MAEEKFNRVEMGKEKDEFEKKVSSLVNDFEDMLSGWIALNGGNKEKMPQGLLPVIWIGTLNFAGMSMGRAMAMIEEDKREETLKEAVEIFVRQVNDTMLKVEAKWMLEEEMKKRGH